MADVVRGMTTTGDDVTGYDQKYIEQKAIETLDPEYVFAHWITPGEIPPNQGSTLRWLIDNTPSGATATNALTNDAGTPITFATRDSFNEDSWGGVAVEEKLHTYGTFVPVRAQDLQAMPKRTMDRLGERIGIRGAETKDDLLRAELDGSGTGYNPAKGAGLTNIRKSIGDGNDNTTLSATDKLTAEDIALATGDLWGRNVKPFSDTGQYVALVHSLAAVHLVTDGGSATSRPRITWEEMHKHVSGSTGHEMLQTGSLGAIMGTQVVRTTKIGTATHDVNAYENLVIGKDCLGDVHQGDAMPKVIISNATASTSDPYGMYATAAWMFQAGSKLIDDDRGQMIVSAV